MLNYDFSGMKYEDLTRMEQAIKAEKQARDDARFNELVITLCNAFNELKQNYPTATWDIDHECFDCGSSACIDVLDYFPDLSPRDICR